MPCDNFDLFLQGHLSEENFLKHLDSCQSCQRAYEIDKQIMADSAQLNNDIKVPNQWSDINHAISSTSSREKRKFLSFSKVLLSAAATLLIVFSLFLLNKNQTTQEESGILTHKTLEKVKNAEEAYVSAINQLEDLAGEKLSQIPEPLAQLYSNKLQLINAQIANCRNALEKNPANAHVRKYLLAVLREKENTLTQIIDSNS